MTELNLLQSDQRKQAKKTFTLAFGGHRPHKRGCRFISWQRCIGTHCHGTPAQALPATLLHFFRNTFRVGVPQNNFTVVASCTKKLSLKHWQLKKALQNEMCTKGQHSRKNLADCYLNRNISSMKKYLSSFLFANTWLGAWASEWLFSGGSTVEFLRGSENNLTP